MLWQPKSQKKIYLKDYSQIPVFNEPPKPKFNTKGLFTVVGISLLVFVLQVVLPLVKPATFSELNKSIDLSQNVLSAQSIYAEQANESESRKAAAPDFFYLTIPKLGIKNARVETNSLDLNPEGKLGHYAGSAIPGENGNTFIYGHSVMAMFFNPTNYKTIFATIDRLTKGDEIIISYNNREIVYEVEDSFVKKPKDINPLSPINPEYLNKPTLTLMTCWPGGLQISRLLVTANLK